MNLVALSSGRTINLDQVVEIRDYPALPEREDFEEPGVTLPATRRRVEIVTTVMTSSYDSGGDYPEFAHTDYRPYVIQLHDHGGEHDESSADATWFMLQVRSVTGVGG